MAKYLKAFYSRIAKDFKQKELLPVKILFFVHMSTLLVLYPYLTIHMRELGINVEETAIMSAVTPVVGILMPPLAGLLADKIGNFRVLLAAFSAFSGLSALLLIFVPIGRVRIIYPEQVVLDVSCGNRGTTLGISLFEEYHCFSQNNASDFDIDMQMESCGFYCQTTNDMSSDTLLQSDAYQIYIENGNDSITSTNKLSPSDKIIEKLPSYFTHHYLLKGNAQYASSIRQLSSTSYYFPSQLFNFSCTTPDPTVYNKSHVYSGAFSVPVGSLNCQYSADNQSEYQLERNFKAHISTVNKSAEDVQQMQRRFVVNYINGENNSQQVPICYKGFGQSPEQLISVQINDSESGENTKLSNCLPRCIASTSRKQLCMNAETIIEQDVKFTFWSYLAVRVFIGIIGGTAYTMFEGAVIAILRKYKADYGLQRMYASLGGMISSPLSGLLIDYASEGKGYTDYRPVFFLYAALKVVSAVLMLFINLEFKIPAVSIVADVLSVINIELISLFVAAFLLGSAWGYIESFLFWLLQDLGGTKSLMGLTITVGGILGIPLLALSGPIIKKYGHANIIFMGFLVYAVRLYGYSIIYNPWLALIFEALECLTHSLCFTAAITYAARLSSMTTDTTVQGILGGLFYGVGKSAGSLVGGYLIKYVGMRVTFQIFSAVTGATAFVYLAFYHIYMKKRSILNMDAATEINANGVSIDNRQKELELTNGIDTIVDKAKSVPYEDTLTNLGYEDTEFDAEKNENQNGNPK